jgi:hypothetical protein
VRIVAEKGEYLPAFDRTTLSPLGTMSPFSLGNTPHSSDFCAAKDSRDNFWDISVAIARRIHSACCRAI